MNTQALSPPTRQPTHQPNGQGFYARVFAVIATAFLAGVLYKMVMPFAGPLLWAAFLAFLLDPLHTRLTKRLRGRATLSLTLLLIATVLLLVGPLAALSSTFVGQAAEVIGRFQSTFSEQARGNYSHFADIPMVGPLLNWLRETLGLRTSQIQSWIVNGAQQLPAIAASLGGNLVLGAVSTLFGFALMLFMLFFFLRDGAEMVDMARDLIPVSRAQRQQLFDHLSAVTRAVVFGIGVTALVQGALVGVAFLVTGLDAPLVFAVAAALFALLPIGGTALVWLPAALVLMSQQRWGMAIVMIAFGIASSSVDNVLRPMLISGRAQVGTLTVFLGILGGASAFGPIGLFLGPVLLALIVVVVRFVVQQRRTAEEPIPASQP